MTPRRPAARQGHMVAHAAGGALAEHVSARPGPQPRLVAEGRRHLALKLKIANAPGTVLFCCLLYADVNDFPAPEPV